MNGDMLTKQILNIISQIDGNTIWLNKTLDDLNKS